MGRGELSKSSPAKRIKILLAMVVVVAAIVVVGAAAPAQAQPTPPFTVVCTGVGPGGGCTGPGGEAFACNPNTGFPLTPSTCTHLASGQAYACQVIAGPFFPSHHRCTEAIGPPGAAPGGGQQQPGAAGGPVTLETENEAHSGAVDLSFSVTNEGDYASQCVPAEQFGNTGNFNNAPSFVQFGSGADDFEPGGVEFAAEPELGVGCDSAVQQSSSGASG